MPDIIIKIGESVPATVPVPAPVSPDFGVIKGLTTELSDSIKRVNKPKKVRSVMSSAMSRRVALLENLLREVSNQKPASMSGVVNAINKTHKEQVEVMQANTNVLLDAFKKRSTPGGFSVIPSPS